jgi:uridylate kinase
MENTTILLKLSGEALQSINKDASICYNKLNFFIEEIKAVKALGYKIAIVIGGGNILRGANISSKGLTRSKADNMGMLATIINSIAVEDALNNSGVPTVLLSAIEVNKVCDFYTAEKAKKILEENKVVIIAGGLSNPYFSTDTAVVLRALEINASIVYKGTQVDGVYDKDPNKNTDAKRYSQISYDEVILNKLAVMDMTSILLAQKEKLPIVIFDIHKKGNFKLVVEDSSIRSTIK